MDFGPYRYSQEREPARPPSVFFDGTRLGLEGTMLATLTIAIPAGLHIGLSVILGYAQRYADGLPAEARPFSLFGYLFASILAIIAVSMLMFFGGSIPTMLYSMGLIAYMLRRIAKHRQKVKLVSTIIGSVCGLIGGILGTLLISLLTDLQPNGTAYATYLNWPAILTIDGILLLWSTLNPLANAVAGAQIGWRLGKQLEDLMVYWFW